MIKHTFIFLLLVSINISLHAQTTLYANPPQRTQVPLVGGGALGWLEPSKKYIVMGFNMEDCPLLQHEGGIAVGDGNLKYRILDGGSYSESAPITVSKPSSVIKSNAIDTFAEYEAELPALIPKLYVAFQIYVNGEPFSANAQAVTNKHIRLTVYLHDLPSDAKFLSDVHYYINGKEIRTVEANETPKSNKTPKW